MTDSTAPGLPVPPDPAVVTSLADLTALYPQPVPRALAKESPVITPGYAELIAASPWCVVATRGEGGIDISPRGDPAGFVQVADEKTLLLPDRRGNNRLDSLKNLMTCPDVGLMFLIPGVGEAIRVRGTAVVSTDPALLSRFTMHGADPVTVLVVTVQTIYFQCQRATLRANLWDAPRVDRKTLPTAGRLQQELGLLDQQAAQDYDADLTDYTTSTLYVGGTKA